MRKAMQVMMAVLLACSVQAEEKADWAEEWKCFDPYDYDKKSVLIEAFRGKPYEIEGKWTSFGVIKAAGSTSFGVFKVLGLDRRWNWGDEYAFVIKPNGDGLYYDFSNIEDGGTTSPSQRFNCVES